MRHLEREDNVSEISETEIKLEQNITDGDFEVVIAARGDDVGMVKFWLFSPERKLIYVVESPKKRESWRHGLKLQRDTRFRRSDASGHDRLK